MEKTAETTSHHPEKQTIPQKILFYSICLLVLLMFVFSLMAMKDKNFGGYQQCIEKKCERGGLAFCQKFREQNNCCLGAGGQLSMTKDNAYTCVFS